MDVPGCNITTFWQPKGYLSATSGETYPVVKLFTAFSGSQLASIKSRVAVPLLVDVSPGCSAL